MNFIFKLMVHSILIVVVGLLLYGAIERWPSELDRNIRLYLAANSISSGVIPVAEIFPKLPDSSGRAIVCVLAPYQRTVVEEYRVDGGEVVRIDTEVSLDLVAAVNEYLEREKIRAGEMTWLVIFASERIVTHSYFHRTRTTVAAMNSNHRSCVLHRLAGLEILEWDSDSKKLYIRLISMKEKSDVAE